MTGVHKEIPDNLLHVVALGKADAVRHLDEFVHKTLRYFETSKSFTAPVTNYMTSLRFGVEVFKNIPDKSYKDLKERERRKFTKEIKELSEKPMSPSVVLKVMKSLNEILEVLLNEGNFFQKKVHPLPKKT